VLNCVSWYFVIAGEMLEIRLDSELVRALISRAIHERWVREASGRRVYTGDDIGQL
jgi:hypothetical protein